jgi:HEAT repeat protein
MKKIFLFLAFCAVFLVSCRTDRTSITFKVSDVKINKEPLTEISAKESVEAFLGEKMEFLSLEKDKLVDLRDALSPRGHGIESFSDMNRFLAALHLSFAEHRPLVLSPDMFWLLIVQGFALHVNQNPEKFRKLLVAHEGRANIEIRRDDFIKGSASNAWNEVLPEFTKKIKAYTKGDINDLIIQRFSTTTKTYELAYRIALMDSLKNYFNYSTMTLCGIPEIRLMGTPKDWAKLIEKTQELSKYDLEWWTSEIIPFLKKIHESSKGNIDCDFWKSIYKINAESGGDTITGWIIKFYPYLLGRSKNNMVYIRNRLIKKDLNKIRPWRAPRINLFPAGLSKAPFKWIIGVPPDTTSYNMEFFTGFLGVKQDLDTKALFPVVAWGVKDDNNALYDSLPERLKPYFRAGCKTKEVTFWELEINDDDLNEISNFINLQDIIIYNGSSITDKGLAKIANLRELTELSIPGSQITDASANIINGFREMYSLNVNGTHLSDAWLKNLDLPKLGNLNISNTKITDDAIYEFIKKYPKVEIDLKGDSVEIDGVDLKKLYDFNFKDNPELMKQVSLLRIERRDNVDPILRIAKIDDFRKLEILLVAVMDGRSRVATYIIKYLYNSNDIKPWLKNLSPQRREAACWILGRYRDYRNFECLYEMLDDEDANVRITAVASLSYFPFSFYSEKVNRLLRSESKTSDFYRILECGRLNDKDKFVENKLRRLYKNANRKEKERIIKIIGDLRLKCLEDIVLQELSRRLSYYSIHTAGEIESQKAVPVLLKALQNKDFSDKGEVIEALGKIKADGTRVTIVNYLENDKSSTWRDMKVLFEFLGKDKYFELLKINKNKKFKALSLGLLCRYNNDMESLTFKLLECKDEDYKEYKNAAASGVVDYYEQWDGEKLVDLKKKYPILNNVKKEVEPLKEKKTYKELVNDLNSNPDEGMRQEVAYELGELRDKRALPYLKKALKEDSDYVGERCGLAIFKIQSKENPELLISKLKDSTANSEIKKLALWEIGELKYKPAMEALEKILQGKQAEMKDEAFVALLKISSEKAAPYLNEYMCECYSEDVLGDSDDYDDLVKEFLLKEYNDKYCALLINALKTPGARHSLALDVLVEKKEKRAIKAIFNLIKFDDIYLEVVEKFLGPEAEDYMIEALNYYYCSDDAVDYLAKHGTEKSVKPLKNLLKYVSKEEQAEIKKAIESIRKRESEKRH